MSKRRILAITAGITALTGCVSPQQVTKTDEITLDNAMKTIACGIATYSNELAKIGLNTGTLTDSVEVTLLLKASSSNKNELVVKAEPNVSGFSLFNIGYTGATTNDSSRDNTIKIIFKNMYFANLNKPGEKKIIDANVPIGPQPSESGWYDEPCEKRSDPMSKKYLLELNRATRGMTLDQKEKFGEKVNHETRGMSSEEKIEYLRYLNERSTRNGGSNY
jgi:hypothetical protein